MKTKLYETRNDLSPDIRRKAIELLNQNLADILDLGLQAKQAHWNVKGPAFIALHELFDKVAEELEESIDEIAERAVALGGIAMGTLQAISSASRLPKYPTNLAAGKEHVQALATSLSKFGASARKAIDTATGFGDADTADLFTGVSRAADKLLWFVEAHIQAEN